MFIIQANGCFLMKSNIRYLWLQVEDKLRSLDEDMSYFMDRLGKANMEDMVNIVLLSDHGMSYGMTPQPRYHPHKFPIGRFTVNEVSVGDALQSMKSMVNMIVGSGAYAMVTMPLSSSFIRHWRCDNYKLGMTLSRMTLSGMTISGMTISRMTLSTVTQNRITCN
jgi:hypothetical protein